MMNKTILALIILCGLLVTSVSTFAADPNSVRVLERGQDANGRIYVVQCPGDTRASLEYNSKTGRLCIYPYSGDVVCIQSKDIDAAARRACGVSR